MSHAIELLLALITISGLIYTALALLAARSFARSLGRVLPAGTFAGELPGVSVLKPLKGADDGLLSRIVCRTTADRGRCCAR